MEELGEELDAHEGVTMNNSGWRSKGMKFRRQKTLFLVLGLVFLVVGNRAVVNAQQSFNAAEVDKLIQYVKEHNQPNFVNFTYDQLKQWFEAQTPDEYKFEVYPRLYPFCLTHAQLIDPDRTRTDSHAYRFHEIFEDIERINAPYYNFNVTTDSVLGEVGKEWIEDIQLSRINAPDPDMVNLRQWLHIKVKAKKALRALYMQSIVGPMGLPFGEFYTNFRCKDEDTTQEPGLIEEIGELSYCSYRPKTTIQHPSVYVGYYEQGRKNWDMHFFWTDITCMETPYLQFLMIAVQRFGFNETFKTKPKLGTSYRPLLSPIYINTAYDTKSGSPFPYYPEWKEEMYCYLNATTLPKLYKKQFPNPNLDKNPIYKNISYRGEAYPSVHTRADRYFAPIGWTKSSDSYRIQANEVYDACLTGRLKNMSERNDVRLECPPGPFRCDTTNAGVKPADIEKQREELLAIEKNNSKCYPCGPPACEALGFPDYKCDYKTDELIRYENSSGGLETVERIVRAKTHAVQAVFAFLVLVPLANFMARFYKEMCGECLCGNGPWIFFHTAAHVLSLTFMWISLGSVMPTLSEINQRRKSCALQYKNDTKGKRKCYLELNKDNPHVVVALIAFGMQHFLVGLGFLRAHTHKLRGIQVALHSHFGYACWLIGAISAIVAGIGKANCADTLILGTMFFVFPFVFTAAGVGIDCLTDKKVGILPPRRQWPTLETIKLEGRGPFTVPKWIVFGVFTGVLFLLWLLTLSSTLTVLGSSENLLGDYAQKVGGLFGGDCGDSETVNALKDRTRVQTKTKKS